MYAKRYGHISLSLLMFLSACSSQSPGEKTTKSLQSIQSWVATVRMASIAWNQHTIPAVYAQQTLDKAQQEIHKESQTVAQASIPAVESSLLNQIETTIQQMAIAIEQGDRSTVSRGIEQLDSEQRAMRALVSHPRKPQ